MHLCLHPVRSEALILDGNILTKWSLVETPHVLTTMQIGPIDNFELKLLGISSLLEDIPQTDQFVLYPSSSTSPVLVPDLFSISYNIDLRAWSDLVTVRTLPVPDEGFGVHSISVSPDGHWLIIGCVDHLVLLDLQTMEIIDEVDKFQIVHNMVFDPTSTFLAVGYGGQGGGATGIFAVVNGQLHSIYPELDRIGIAWANEGDLAGSGSCMAFSPDSKWLAIYFDDGTESGYSGELVLYEVSTGRRCWHRTFNSSDERFKSDIVFTPDGEYLISGSLNGYLCMYSASDGQFIRQIDTESTNPVSALARQTGNSIIWAVVDNQLRAFDPLIEEPT